MTLNRADPPRRPYERIGGDNATKWIIGAIIAVAALGFFWSKMNPQQNTMPTQTTGQTTPTTPTPVPAPPRTL
jgi:hypothetical protein